MMSRAEHLEWCKERARQYCDAGNAKDALASMFSDLETHPETAGHVAIMLGMGMMFSGGLREPGEARKFIEGFN